MRAFVPFEMHVDGVRAVSPYSRSRWSPTPRAKWHRGLSCRLALRSSHAPLHPGHFTSDGTAAETAAFYPILGSCRLSDEVSIVRSACAYRLMALCSSFVEEEFGLGK
jgi:hypothetical protein